MMLPIITLVLVAVCCSPGAGAPDIRRQRDVQGMKYTFYESGGGGGSGGYSGTQVKRAPYSKDEAQMFSYLFQACCCLYNGCRNAPPEKKPQLYEYLVTHTLMFVNQFASSCGTTPEGLFPNKEQYDIYLEMLAIQRDGQYHNIGRVEHACDNLFANLGGALATTLQNVGCTAVEIANSLFSITGSLGLPFLDGILTSASGVVSGLLGAAGGLVGGVGNLAGQLVGGALGAVGGLTGGSGGGGLLGGTLGTVGKITGGVTGGILGGGGGGGGGLLGGGGGGGLLGGGGGGGMLGGGGTSGGFLG